MGFELGNTNSTGFSILKPRMGTPVNSLVTWQEAGSLSFKEEKAFGEGRAVVVCGGGETGEKTEEKQSRHGNEIGHFGEGEM